MEFSTQSAQDEKLYFDNIEIRKVKHENFIKQAGFSSGGVEPSFDSEAAPADTDQIRLYFEEALFAGSVSADSFAFYEDETRIYDFTVRYDAGETAAVFDLSRRLESGHSYRIYTQKGLLSADGKAFSDGIVVLFQAAASAYDITGVEVRRGGRRVTSLETLSDGDAVTANVYLQNQNGSSGVNTIAVAFYSGETLVGYDIQEVSVPPHTSDFVLETEAVTLHGVAGELRVEAYLLSSMAERAMLRGTYTLR